MSDKDVTRRTAKVSGKVILTEEAFQLAKSGASAKGDIFGTARIAAIHAAKSTAYLVPMCHTLMIESVDADFALHDAETGAFAKVMKSGTIKTGDAIGVIENESSSTDNQ
ncbi:MAG: cyclic pyranopterin monophosphate synthase MoaC [Planctomycetota bacterium]